MAALQSSNPTPHHTFLEKKPPLLPRQSTSDVLSFTHIIANRLASGQTVWDFFSPPPSTTSPTTATTGENGNTATTTAIAPGGVSPPASPTLASFSQPSPATTPAAETPPSTMTTTTANTKATNRRSLLFFGSLTKSSPALDIQETVSKNDGSNPPTTTNINGPLSPVSPTTGPSPTIENNVSHYAQAAEPTPKAQKRKSFAQSLRNMLSLSSLLSSSKSSSPPPSATPPHYNILVLGSDSAPLASTLYKMSGVLPGASKIGHYQEISGFFVAYFKSDGSFSCSPPSQGTTESEQNPPMTTSCPTTTTTKTGDIQGSTTSGAAAVAADNGDGQVDSKMAEEVAALVVKRASDVQADEIKSRRRSSGEYTATPDESALLPRSSAESSSTLTPSSACSSTDDLSLKTAAPLTTATTTTTISSAGDNLARVETLVDDDEQTSTAAEVKSSSSPSAAVDPVPEPTAPVAPPRNPSANATLSIHAFSLDTTWPVPRILAQTFWFPHAHGIIYVVDATRKNDPRGMDHLLHARQFLASLVSDPCFKRADIPVVVFANKAGLDDSCFRVDEIADILGCEEWDEAHPCPHGLNGEDHPLPASHHQLSASAAAASATTTTGGSSSPALLPSSASSSSASSTSTPPPRPWCVKSTRADGSGDGLRESVEWLKSRMGEVWKS